MTPAYVCGLILKAVLRETPSKLFKDNQKELWLGGSPKMLVIGLEGTLRLVEEKQTKTDIHVWGPLL